MPVEESVTTGGNTSLTRNFVGARGIEAMFLTQGGSTTTSYPLYDVHGNMVATVAKNSSGTSWTIQDERSYDVWGSVRSGAATGGPRGRYCANLGHVQDDESALVYMRARYYEPGTGRFVNEDPARDGSNWYIYTSNTPTTTVDPSGQFGIDVLWSMAAAFLTSYVITLAITQGNKYNALVCGIINGIAAGAISLASNGIAKVAEKSTWTAALALTLKISAGVAINMVATFLIDMLTAGEMTPLDYILGGISGGVSGGIAGNTGFLDDIIAGSLQNSLPSAISGGINFWTN